jgi:hypothetical protein
MMHNYLRTTIVLNKSDLKTICYFLRQCYLRLTVFLAV